MADKPNTADTGKPHRWQFQFRLRTLLVLVAAIPGLILVCDRIGVSIGDGWLDVEMRYRVVDAETERVIPDATVEFIDDYANSDPSKTASHHLRPMTTVSFRG